MEEIRGQNSMFQNRTLKKPEIPAAQNVVTTVVQFWQRAGIPIMSEKSAGRKLFVLHGSWKKRQKGRNRTSAVQNSTEKEFDTTASNTGVMSGACVLIEQSTLNLVCRHHVMEVVAEKALSECLGPSAGPEILFSRFRDRWEILDTSPANLRPLGNEEANQPIFKRDELLKTYNHHLLLSQPRDDFRELLEQAIIAL